jgi:predicted TIM-barrel fold metal-dependent hydrolase
MKIISIEEHFLTREITTAWETSAIGSEGTGNFDQGEIRQRLEDVGEGRLTLMDESGVDVQVLSVTTPALHNLEPVESVRLARSTNDLVAAAIARHPTRFQGLAVLPMPAPDEAAALELRRAVTQCGLCGAMVCGRTRDKNLDHPHFLPVLRTAAELNVPVFIHPQIPQASVRAALYAGFGEPVDTAFAAFGLGWHYEAGVQFVRLILARVFDRFPNLQIILGHSGEVVLFYVERLKSLARVAKLERPVEEYFQRNLYVTSSGMWNQTYLQRALEIVGQERILFSTDYPYQYRPGQPGRSFLLATDLSQGAREAFAHGNWERLTSQRSS